MVIERRRVQAEERAARKFLAHLIERYPLHGRVAYPIKNNDKTVYIKLLVVGANEHLETEIRDFGAVITGLIAEQEGIPVLLTTEDPINAPPITSDEELKLAQQTISNYVQLLAKLRTYNDLTAQQQREQYLMRLPNYYRAVMDYLVTEC